MGQAESKIFEDAPIWDLKMLLKRTDLKKEEINYCWKKWASDKITAKGKIDLKEFMELMKIPDGDPKLASEAEKMFNLLDIDDDEAIEFPELLLFIFAKEPDMSKEQQLRRSYNFYDNNGSGKISKEEMVETLDKLEKIEMREDDKGNLIIPDNVENLFSLMDFGGDGKIIFDEFMKATLHYRRLGNLLTIDLLSDQRKALLQEMSTEQPE